MPTERRWPTSAHAIATDTSPPPRIAVVLGKESAAAVCATSDRAARTTANRIRRSFELRRRFRTVRSVRLGLKSGEQRLIRLFFTDTQATFDQQERGDYGRAEYCDQDGR